ncbi:MAG: hypothetical protein SWY16_03345 [Cyanobacteriota bacterium]|nr:hypothetical protein [Cyanobacteriota bacterium]
MTRKPNGKTISIAFPFLIFVLLQDCQIQKAIPEMWEIFAEGSKQCHTDIVQRSPANSSSIANKL